MSVSGELHGGQHLNPVASGDDHALGDAGLGGKCAGGL